MKIVDYKYHSKDITQGIVHIGVGNFHRAHQAFYTNVLLEDNDQKEWGICGISLLSSDEKNVENLKSQDLDYTLTVCGRDGSDQVYKIGALQELIAGYENPKAVIDKIAERSIKIISLTITEGGYNLDKGTGNFDLEDEKIKHDIENPRFPSTVFGFIAEGLRVRKHRGNGSITILSCDNLQHNGDTAKKAFTTFINAQDDELASWVMQNVTFPNSMVDRITPSTNPADIKRLNANSGSTDKVPVYCEDFIQWVIEDDFIAGRPAWERVGVEFVNDVSAFENMKLSLLNASHTLLCYPAFLSGYRKVDNAMHDPLFTALLMDFMNIDITPYVPAPKETNLELYKKTLIERFANRSVSDQLSRLCYDGISKFPVYIMPNLSKMIKDGKDLKRITFLIAAYRHYLKYKKDSKGLTYDVAEPWLTSEDSKFIESSNPLDFLNLTPFKSYNLMASEKFTQEYLYYAEIIKEKGITAVLNTIVSKN
ncbi:mannitol dehydrogenase family protein [Flavobacterium sp. LAR06]|uniref:mannitol dehydrogenase family protein n=1 Tax=Flavobacterium sp. LAR06 TaxID=3064897 RepID=UPI0035BF238D